VRASPVLRTGTKITSPVGQCHCADCLFGTSAAAVWSGRPFGPRGPFPIVICC